MAHTYEGLFILNTTGKEESSKELIEKIEKEIQTVGGTISKIERMDKRPFARVAHDLDSGYYVNIVFDVEPVQLDVLRAKLKLDDDVFRVVFMRARARTSAPRVAAKVE